MQIISTAAQGISILAQIALSLFDRLQEGGVDPQTFDSTFATTGSNTTYYKWDNTVYQGDEINYIGIGMWAASEDMSYFCAEMLTSFRKMIWYGEFPSDGTLYWLQQGYSNYFYMQVTNNWSANWPTNIIFNLPTNNVPLQ
jgi:hypothetical protein